jgi:hypothetical protein
MPTLQVPSNRRVGNAHLILIQGMIQEGIAIEKIAEFADLSIAEVQHIQDEVI